MTVVKLTCGHSVEIKHMYVRDDAGEEYCPEHQNWFLVMGAWSETWHSKCRGCRYARSHGKSRVWAERAAVAHHVQTLHSTYVAWYSDAPEGVRLAVVKEERVLPEEHGQDMLPPF